MAASDQNFVIAAHRFGLGAKPDGRARAGSDLRAPLLAEMTESAQLIRQNDLPTTAQGIQIVSQIEERQREMREAKRQLAQLSPQASPAPGAGGVSGGMASAGMASGDMASAGSAASATPGGTSAPKPPPPDPDAVRMRDVLHAEARLRLANGLVPEFGFAERWAMFWANHFCVALRRGRIIEGIVGPYEREAIRPHVFGRFLDLLIAAESHPAMLHYLDQRQSIGPGSPAGQRRNKGLNENLARETLELHTLGVGGGYTQADVTSFAKVLTGWSITNQEENLDGYGGFVFAPNRHEPGPQTVLGKVYRQTGREQGLAVLTDLAQHPSTAKFLAGKLARHFVADEPPPALVGALEAEFRRTGGDLAAVARVLILSEAAWAAPRTKIRTPYEFLVATLRATGETVDRVPQYLHTLNMMGQPLWNPAGPNGHADDEASMLSPKSVKTRLEFAFQISRQIGGRLDPRELAAALFGEVLSAETRTAIARAESRPQGVALLLMSPEFQRR